MKVMAPRHSVLAALEILCIRYYRESTLSVIPKDVIKIIGREILATKNDKEWVINKFEHLKKGSPVYKA